MCQELPKLLFNMRIVALIILFICYFDGNQRKIGLNKEPAKLIKLVARHLIPSEKAEQFYQNKFCFARQNNFSVTHRFKTLIPILSKKSLCT
jgi:hypothetical protein